MEEWSGHTIATIPEATGEKLKSPMMNEQTAIYRYINHNLIQNRKSGKVT